MDENSKIRVTNRYNGEIGYDIPDLGNLQRSFQPGETKTLTFEELFKLSQVPGGEYILKNYLTLDNKEAAIELFNEDPEPEFFYQADDVKNVLINGSLDQLEDCLNFAPLGVIEILKDLAVSLPLNDMSKRQLIFEKTGFNVTKAIENSKEEDEKLSQVVQRKSTIPVKNTAPTETKIVRKVVATK